jgi:hypothetical protein
MKEGLVTLLVGLVFALAALAFDSQSNIEAAEWEGADHIIDFGQEKIVLKEKGRRRDCYFDIGKDSILHWGGEPASMQKIYFQSWSKDFIKGVAPPLPKKNVWDDNKQIPVKTFYSSVLDDGTLQATENIERWDVLKGVSLGLVGHTAHWTVLEAVCSGEALKFMTKHGGELKFSRSEVRRWKKPFEALQSCIKDSSQFQFGNSLTDFAKYYPTVRKCWWQP